jgi:hypothetical protein
MPPRRPTHQPNIRRRRPSPPRLDTPRTHRSPTVEPRPMWQAALARRARGPIRQRRPALSIQQTLIATVAAPHQPLRPDRSMAAQPPAAQHRPAIRRPTRRPATIRLQAATHPRAAMHPQAATRLLPRIRFALLPPIPLPPPRIKAGSTPGRRIHPLPRAITQPARTRQQRIRQIPARAEPRVILQPPSPQAIQRLRQVALCRRPARPVEPMNRPRIGQAASVNIAARPQRQWTPGVRRPPTLPQPVIHRRPLRRPEAAIRRPETITTLRITGALTAQRRRLEAATHRPLEAVMLPRPEAAIDLCVGTLRKEHRRARSKPSSCPSCL